MMRSMVVVFQIAILMFAGVLIAQTMHVDAHASMVGCPFMPSEKIPCLMDLFDHMAMVQQVAAVTVPLLMLLLISLGVWWIGHVLSRASEQTHARPPTRTPLVAPLFFVQLFSEGILHSKAP